MITDLLLNFRLRAMIFQVPRPETVREPMRWHVIPLLVGIGLVVCPGPIPPMLSAPSMVGMEAGAWPVFATSAIAWQSQLWLSFQGAVQKRWKVRETCISYFAAFRRPTLKA